MIHKHKDLHISTTNSFTLRLRIDQDQATTQLEALGCRRGDTVSIPAWLDLYTTGDIRRASQSTCAIWEVL